MLNLFPPLIYRAFIVVGFSSGGKLEASNGTVEMTITVDK